MENNEDADIFVTFDYDGQYRAVSTYARPFVNVFLDFAFEHFEVVFYTSSVHPYANQILDYLDSENKAVSRLFRESWITRDGIYIKTIDKLQRKPWSVIILDNNPITWWFNSENVFPIKSWFKDFNDTELSKSNMILFCYNFSKFRRLNPNLKISVKSKRR